MTSSEAAEKIGVCRRTLFRWEKAGLIKIAKRNYINHRVYTKEDVENIKNMYEELK